MVDGATFAVNPRAAPGFRPESCCDDLASSDEIEAFAADISPQVLAILEKAETPHTRPEPAEAVVLAALPHADACLAMAAAALGVAADWCDVHADSAVVPALRVVALGYCPARLGDGDGGAALLRKAAALDPEDRIGTAAWPISWPAAPPPTMSDET